MNQILKTLIFFVALKDPVASSVQIGDPCPQKAMFSVAAATLHNFSTVSGVNRKSPGSTALFGIPIASTMTGTIFGSVGT